MEGEKEEREEEVKRKSELSPVPGYLGTRPRYPVPAQVPVSPTTLSPTPSKMKKMKNPK
jgi:hypothetical protein